MDGDSIAPAGGGSLGIIGGRGGREEKRERIGARGDGIGGFMKPREEGGENPKRVVDPAFSNPTPTLQRGNLRQSNQVPTCPSRWH
jgi:hypothetical protein